MCLLPKLAARDWLTSFRGGSKSRTRNLEIPGSTLTRRPGMTTSSSLHRLDAFPVGLAIVEALEADVLEHGVAELVLVDPGHRQTLLLEEIDQLGFVGLDFGGRLGGG